MAKLIIARKDRCENCGREYLVGWNGIDGRLCDKCARIKRDKRGYIRIKKQRKQR